MADLSPEDREVARIQALKTFVRWEIEGLFGDGLRDEVDVQDKLEALGLIELAAVGFDPAVHTDESGCLEPGDAFFMAVDWLREDS